MMGSMLEILILQIPCTWNADCTLCMWEVWCFMTETWAIKTKVSRGWSVLRWAWWSRCAIQYSDPFLITFAISIYSLLSTFYDHFTSLTLLFYSLTLCLKASVTCQLKLALFFSLSFYCSCIYWVFSLTFFFKPLSNLFCWWKKKKHHAGAPYHHLHFHLDDTHYFTLSDDQFQFSSHTPYKTV